MSTPKNTRRTLSPKRLLLLTVPTLAILVGGLFWRSSSFALSPQEQHELVQQAHLWVQEERTEQRPHAEPLTDSEKQLYAPFFPPEVLEEARVRAVDSMPSPRFLSKIRHKGQRVFNFRRAVGLALDDTLLLRGADVPAGSPARRSVLFHELVHSVQYQALGVESFMQLYLASLVANDYSYPNVAFEHQAFELQHRFNVDPGTPFSVEDEVADMVQELQETLGSGH